MSNETENSAADLIEVGKISGVFGVKGWVKVFSHCEPRENILIYPQWFLVQRQSYETFALVTGKPHGKTIIAKLEGIESPEEARLLMGRTIHVSNDSLPKLSGDEYYWKDLQGLSVETVAGENLGCIDWLFETGSNAVMVVKDADDQAERLVPFIQGQVVTRIDLDKKLMVVDWDPDF